PRKEFICTTDSNHGGNIYPNALNQEFEVGASNEVWATDITYIHTGEGFLFLNPIMDLYSRRIISFRIDDHMRQELSINTLKEAIALRQPKKGWIHHSDRGAQYCASKYVDILKESGATISMSRKAMPYDNACMESFFASLKKEFVYKQVFRTKEEAILGIRFYIKFYNEKRMHSSLDYLSPLEMELSYQTSQQQWLMEEQEASV